MIEDRSFHEMFTEDQKNEKKKILASVPNLDVLITELHYVILNIKLKDVRPNWKWVVFLLLTILHNTSSFCWTESAECAENVTLKRQFNNLFIHFVQLHLHDPR